MSATEPPESVGQLLQTPDLATALESDHFKQFLDKVPVAIAVSELDPSERIVYANVEFERLTHQASSKLLGDWARLPGESTGAAGTPGLGQAVTEQRDYLGSFLLPDQDGNLTVDAWSNIIDDDRGHPVYRLVALVETAPRRSEQANELEEQVREKDTQLRELQHRVKNNLQMITTLIRVEARRVREPVAGAGFDRLAGRVEALGLLYNALADEKAHDAVDLGIYLSEIASAVMRAHAVEGIRLDLKVDTWPVSIDVAMPTGLVVNELLMNALKHAFEGRDGGTITLHCTTDSQGSRVVIADDGIGLPEGTSWPLDGKLSALIVRSLVQNGKARVDVESAPGKGTVVTITFNAVDAAPAA